MKCTKYRIKVCSNTLNPLLTSKLDCNRYYYTLFSNSSDPSNFLNSSGPTYLKKQMKFAKFESFISKKMLSVNVCILKLMLYK